MCNSMIWDREICLFFGVSLKFQTMYPLDSSFDDLVTRLHPQVVGFTCPRAIATKGSCCHKRTYPSKAKLIWWAFPLKQQMLRSFMLDFLWLLYVFLLFDQKTTAKLRIIKLMAVIIMHLGAAVLECLTMTVTEVWFFFQSCDGVRKGWLHPRQLTWY